VALDDILRNGAGHVLQKTIQAEVATCIEQHATLADPHTGHRLMVRNGFQPERSIQSGLGEIAIRKPRILDRRPGHTFTSHILPPCRRRTPSLEALIPILYLKGVSTNDFAVDLTVRGVAGIGAEVDCRPRRRVLSYWPGRGGTRCIA
jgi:transposase-like protein